MTPRYTPEQIVAKCLAQGVVFHMNSDGGFDLHAPKSVATPKFLDTMLAQHDALLPAVMAHLAEVEAQSQENDTTAIVSHDAYEDLSASLVAEGQAAEAALQAEQDKRLQDAVDAARAKQMPTHWVDHMHTPNDPTYDPSYRPVEIRKGVTLADPGWWLQCAIERAQGLRARYGETWWHKDASRPLADSDGPMLWEEIEVVRDWWFEWRHKKGLIK